MDTFVLPPESLPPEFLPAGTFALSNFWEAKSGRQLKSNRCTVVTGPLRNYFSKALYNIVYGKEKSVNVLRLSLEKQKTFFAQDFFEIYVRNLAKMQK